VRACGGGRIRAISRAMHGRLERFSLRFAELESADGSPLGDIAFTDFELEPLGYNELATAKLHQTLSIPLRMRGGTVVQSTISGIDPTMRYDARAQLASSYSSRAIGLVRGGWLPSALAAMNPATMVFVDRNVVSQIVGRFSRGKAKRTEPDFLDLFASQAVRINPLLYVLEGNGRRPPDEELAREQLDEVITKLSAALPEATIAVGENSLTAALGLIADSYAGLQRKERFLTAIGGMLAAPVSAARRRDCWRRVIAAASESDLPLNSLVVMAALSAVSVPNGASPARRLLKFRPGYDREEAYNALTDLRALELLTSFMAMYPETPIQLCTCDKDLALFWVGARASNCRQTNNGFAFDLAPVTELLPSGALEEWAALVRP
jgi:hypothetical protein